MNVDDTTSPAATPSGAAASSRIWKLVQVDGGDAVPHGPNLHRVVALSVLGATSLVLLMLVGPVRSAIQTIDDAWVDIMVDAETAGLVRSSEALAFLGSAYVTVPLRVSIAAWFVASRRRLHLLYWLSTILLSEVAISLLKASFGRRRPSLTLEATRSSSFPSGHAVASTVTLVALVYLLTRPGLRRRAWFLLAGLGALFMAASRTYLRVHWLSDVIVGVTIGWATALLALWIIERVRVAHRQPPPVEYDDQLRARGAG